MERLFGPLFRQFRILYNRCRLENVVEIETIVKACCILYNKTAARRGYNGIMKFRRKLEEDEKLDLNIDEVLQLECRYEQARQWREEYANVEDTQQHGRFSKALIEHIWSKTGDD